MAVTEFENLAVVAAAGFKAIMPLKAAICTMDKRDNGAMHWLVREVLMDCRQPDITGMCPFTFESIGCAATGPRERFVAAVDFFIKAMPIDITDTLFHGACARWCDAEQPQQWLHSTSAPPAMVLAAKSAPFSLEQCYVRDGAVVFPMGGLEYAVRLFYTAQGAIAWTTDMHIYEPVNLSEKVWAALPPYPSREALLALKPEVLVLERIGETRTDVMACYPSSTAMYMDNVTGACWFSDSGMIRHTMGPDMPKPKSSTGYMLNLNIQRPEDMTDTTTFFSELQPQLCVHLIVCMPKVTNDTCDVYLNFLQSLLKKYTNIINFRLIGRVNADAGVHRESHQLHPALNGLKDLKHLMNVHFYNCGDLINACQVASILNKNVEFFSVTGVCLVDRDNMLQDMLSGSDGLANLSLYKVTLKDASDLDEALHNVSNTLLHLDAVGISFEAPIGNGPHTRRGLYECHKITHLKLGNIRWGAAIWNEIVSSVYNMPYLIELRLFPTAKHVSKDFSAMKWISAKHTLRFLTLSYFSGEEMAHLIGYMNHSNSLRNLSLGNCLDQNQGIQMKFFQALANCTNMLFLEFTRFNIAHDAVLADALKQMPFLDHFALRNVIIKTPVLLCKALSGHRLLRSLELQGVTSMKEDAVLALVGKPENMPGMRRLTIAACSMPDTAVDSMVSWIDAHRGLTSLSLICNDYGPQSSIKLTKAATALSYLQVFTVGGVDMDRDAVKTISDVAISKSIPSAHLKIGYDFQQLEQDASVQVKSASRPAVHECVVPVCKIPIKMEFYKGWDVHAMVRDYIGETRAQYSLSSYLLPGAPTVLVASTPAVLQLPALPLQRMDILGKREASTEWVKVGFYSPEMHSHGRVYVDTHALTDTSNTGVSCVFRMDCLGARCSDPVYIRPGTHPTEAEGKEHIQLHCGVASVYESIDNFLKCYGKAEAANQRVVTVANKLGARLEQKKRELAEAQQEYDAAMNEVNDGKEFENGHMKKFDGWKQDIAKKYEKIDSHQKSFWVKLETAVRFGSVEALGSEDVRMLLKMLDVPDLPAECQITGHVLKTFASLTPECQAKLSAELGIPPHMMRAKAVLAHLGARLQRLVQGEESDLWNVILAVNNDVEASPSASPAKRQKVEKASLDCPISMETLKDPVTTTDGHTYSRSCIKEWLKTSKISPTTRRPMDGKVLSPNVQVQECLKRARDE